MNVLNIPFVEKTGIQRSEDGCLQLPASQEVHNHLNTIHASAQFALAETASGECLLTLFPELADKVIPVLRDAQIKFRRPALSTLKAYPSVTAEAQEKFHAQLANKGRAAICVQVELKDAEGSLTLSGDYNWFVQTIE